MPYLPIQLYFWKDPLHYEMYLNMIKLNYWSRLKQNKQIKQSNY